MSDEQTIEQWISALTVLRPEPGDVIVLRSPHRLSMDAWMRLRDSWEHGAGQSAFKDVPVLVLEEGMDIGLISAEKMRAMGWQPTEKGAG